VRAEQTRVISWQENAGSGTSKLGDRSRAQRIEIEGGDQKSSCLGRLPGMSRLRRARMHERIGAVQDRTFPYGSVLH
jgi:hypothetical protein